MINLASKKQKFDGWKGFALFLLGLVLGTWLTLGIVAWGIVESAENLRIEKVEVGLNETAIIDAMVAQQEARGMIPPKGANWTLPERSQRTFICNTTYPMRCSE